ncbi:MAG: hypothetical protein HOG49_06320 [Candidatus Scalindua sp.]|jgi:hypothetical protein|nr:hypothetical protein [Candidatus Scalindua sp.]
MANMNYCRFQNTLVDLRQCHDEWDEIDDDCPEEKMARYKMLKLCQSIVDSFPAEEYKPERAGDGN